MQFQIGLDLLLGEGQHEERLDVRVRLQPRAVHVGQEAALLGDVPEVVGAAGDENPRARGARGQGFVLLRPPPPLRVRHPDAGRHNAQEFAVQTDSLVRRHLVGDLVQSVEDDDRRTLARERDDIRRLGMINAGIVEHALDHVFKADPFVAAGAVDLPQVEIERQGGRLVRLERLQQALREQLAGDRLAHTELAEQRDQARTVGRVLGRPLDEVFKRSG